MSSRLFSSAAIVTVVLTLSCTERAQPPRAPTGPLLSETSPLQAITIVPSNATVEAGQTLQLSTTTIPHDAAPVYTWTTTDAGIAKVAHTGLVIAVAPGTVAISATASGIVGTATITVTAPQPAEPAPTPPPTNDVVLVGAGDIASCSVDGDEATANLLDAIPGIVFTLGDNEYDDASSTAAYLDCYGPNWGRHLSRTRPAPGNHEYETQDAAGYFGYFGHLAGDRSRGYYSYDAGDWHVVVLNSNSSCSTISCAAGSPQEQWLRADLAANTKACTLAYWHHPRFNSGAAHGNNTDVAPFWDALYEYNADVILNGHEHVYERFAPQTPAAVADPARGIRQFTVGTGGRTHYAFAATQPNSEVRNADTFGVLKLTLHATSYDWQFIPVAGATFTDSGSGTCH